jgi:thiamine biosynthesis lipoprotein
MQDATYLAQKLAALADLGLERVDVAPVTSEAFLVERSDWKVITSRPAMGTLVTISAISRSRQRADLAVEHALDEMDRLIGLFSRFEPRSAVSYLNETGRLDGAPPEVTRVVGTALDYHEVSSGAFDITVAPVLELFRTRFEGPVPGVPSDAEIRETMERVGSQHVHVSRRRIRFERDGVEVTLDGIAKGYIVDAVARVLDRHGVRRYLVNAGGDIRSRGTTEGGRPWTVAVRDPLGGSAFVDTIHLTGGAVATSGSYEIHFDDDMTFHHIVDAHTGRSPLHAASVSVVAPTAMAADALATSVFVLGPSPGVALVDGLRGCACLVVDRDGQSWASKRWRSAPLTDGVEAAP